MPTQEQIDELSDAAEAGDLGRREWLSAFADELEGGAYCYQKGEGLVPK
jgi:hypothetical protein